MDAMEPVKVLVERGEQHSLGAISISSVVTREGQAVFEGISKSWKAGKRLRL